MCLKMKKVGVFHTIENYTFLWNVVWVSRHWIKKRQLPTMNFYLSCYLWITFFITGVLSLGKCVHFLWFVQIYNVFNNFRHFNVNPSFIKCVFFCPRANFLEMPKNCLWNCREEGWAIFWIPPFLYLDNNNKKK